MLKFLRYWLPLVLYIACIFILSSFSKISRDLTLGLNDKILHGLEYAILAALMVRALRSIGWPQRAWISWMLAVVTVLALGGLDEYYQGTIPGRNSDILDLLADGVGAVIGGGIYLLVKRKMTVRANN